MAKFRERGIVEAFQVQIGTLAWEEASEYQDVRLSHRDRQEFNASGLRCKAEVGDWLVNLPDGRQRIIPDAEFRAKYEPAE